MPLDWNRRRTAVVPVSSLGEAAGAQFEFTLAAIAQNLRRLAKLTVHPPDRTVPRVA